MAIGLAVNAAAKRASESRSACVARTARVISSSVFSPISRPPSMSVVSARRLLHFLLQRGDPSGEAAEQRLRRGRRLRRLHHRLIAGADVLFWHLPTFIGELL